jgi:hypothetical protein
MTSKALALAATAMAFIGSFAPIGPTPVTYQDVRVSAPGNQTPARTYTATKTAARDEIERADELTAVPPLLLRGTKDGRHRTSGDRAHKRMKRRRASGRH